jgi:hypothetical protein
VPRAKFTKASGPLPAIEQIQRSKFEFRNDHWRALTKLLSPKLSALSLPSDERFLALGLPPTTQAGQAAPATLPSASVKFSPKIKSIADLVIVITEEAINSYRTGSPIVSKGRINPPNARAAIRRLRTDIRRLQEALKPFERGWVDSETADIVPPNLVPTDLDAKLAARDQEIAKLGRLAPTPRRSLAFLCQIIVGIIKQLVSAQGETVSEKDILRYVDAALKFASIKHPNIPKHRDRFARLCFPKDSSPHSAG